ncbi:arginase family protein [Pseudomonas typographi]|uniref:arginase family protein n=1 Tax=Pseudomonas typographi TaxID=2715964 RepID=UPI001684491E|nr:arginase family protein [Pseudomonas typographi]MBD1553113.1 agmatinase [Pseudomonas typographi]
MSHYPTWPEILAGKHWRTTHFPRIKEDMPTFLGVPHAIREDDLQGADVVIIGAPFAAGWGSKYSGVDKAEWLAATTRVRQQSIRYRGGYVQEFDLDIFEYLKVVDYGEADIPVEASYESTVERILEAQEAVERKVKQALAAGAVPVVIGQNSPCASYGVGRPVAEHINGPMGMISLDTHWDAWPYDWATMSPHIAGSTNWKDKLFRDCPGYGIPNLVEIGERGMLESPEVVRHYVNNGACFMPMWKVRTELGIEGVIKNLDQAYQGTAGVYAHFDMDVLGGAGPGDGDLLGELAEPMGMTDYEAIRIAHEIGKRGCDGFSFLCIPPGSAVQYRVVVYVLTYFLAGLAMRKIAKAQSADKEAPNA